MDKHDQKKWIMATLMNDETSTDDEMFEYFEKESDLTWDQIKAIVATRKQAFKGEEDEVKRKVEDILDGRKEENDEGPDTRDELNDNADRLEEIIEEIKELLGEAEDLVSGTNAEARASAYWIPHIRMSLDDDHSWLGSGSSTIQEAADDLRAEAKGDPDEDEDEKEEAEEEEEAEDPEYCDHKDQETWFENDAQGICLGKVCAKCQDTFLKKYRPEIITGYTQEDVSEPIDEAE